MILRLAIFVVVIGISLGIMDVLSELRAIHHILELQLTVMK